jgi:hypothetical protein
MKNNITLVKISAVFMMAVILIAGASACGSTPEATPIIQTMIHTQVVPVQVTQVATQEVTVVVKVPVTVTPAPAAEPTSTPDPNVTPTGPSLPLASLAVNTDCLYGPAEWYEYKSSFPAGQVEVMGKSADGNWLSIEEVGGWNSCWIMVSQAQLVNTQVEALPVVQPILPIEVFGLASPYASAKRNGDVVTISWAAVTDFSADEIRGYLIRAKLCQDGQIVPQDIFIPMTYAENVGTLTLAVIDEGGCSEASDIRMISYARRGFAFYYQSNKLGWEKVFFPPHP